MAPRSLYLFKLMQTRLARKKFNTSFKDFLRILTAYEIITECHAMSCIDRALKKKKNILSTYRLVAVALTSLTIYSLKWSVPPNFFSVERFSSTFQQIVKKWTKNQCAKFKNFQFFFSNFGIRAAVKRVQIWPLNENTSPWNVTSTLNFVYRSTWTIIGR